MTPDDLTAVRRAAERPVAAGAGDLEGAAGDLSAAFADEPILGWMLRDDARRAAARLDLFRRIVGRMIPPGGKVLRPSTGGAAAVWIPSEAFGPTPLWRELKGLPFMLATTGWARFGRAAALRKAMATHHPHAPHAYLWFLGVAPEMQGAGVGSRLLKAELDRLDGEGRPAFLETATERNIGLYRRHGFETVSEYRPAPDGPLIRAMWREPGSA